MQWPSKEEITQILVENIVGSGKTFESIQNSWFVKHLIIALREAIWVLLLMAKMVYKNLTAITSTGKDLDDKGYDFGVDRKPAVKAQHTVTLHKSTNVARNTPVPDNFLLTTTPVGSDTPIKFTVVKGQNLSIPKGEKSVIGVIVECTQCGEIGNVPKGAINLVAQSGFDSVSDSEIYIDGVEIENDESYRKRILERKRKPSRAGVPADWERWALEVEGVTNVKCYRCARGAGTADIVIWGTNGDFPSQGLIDLCQSHIDTYTPADICDEGHGKAIMVVSPEPVEINICISDVVLKKGYTLDTVKTILENAFKLYFRDKKANKSVLMVDCIVCVRTAYDMEDVEKSPVVLDFILSSPEQNIDMVGRQAPVLGSLTINIRE